MTLQIILGLLLRHALTAVGGGAFVDGMLAGNTIDQLAGAVVAILGVGLSALDKRK